MSTILDQLVLRVCNSSGSVKTCHGPVVFFLAVILYSRFKGMLQEHLIQGKIHQV